MLGKNRWRTIAKAVIASALVILLVLNPFGVQSAAAAWKDRFRRSEPAKSAAKLSSKVSETAPPSVIQELRQVLDEYQPQVAILSPRPNEVLPDNTVSVRFQVKDLPIFKNDQLGLGPHLHVFLDNEPYRAVYDLSQPLVLENLEPGTHSLRVFASRPWHESFKNEGAYAQTTFHIFTKTGNNQPDPTLPLLTYSRPQASYGAEPIMLDFYLTNAPLHLIAREDAKDEIADWRIRCTVNGESFVLDNWQPVYLKGFKPGKNWVQLEFLDEKGEPVPNVFNNTVRLITYEPNGKDTLSKLVRGELSAAEARGIVDPNYKPEVLEPTPSPTPVESIAPVPAASPSPIPTPEVTPTPEEVEPVAPTPIPSAGETPESAAEKLEEDKQPQPISSPPSESVPAVVPETPKPKAPKGGFFNRFRPAPASVKPISSPTPEVSPSPEAIAPPQAAEPTPEPTPTESPEAAPPEVPQVLESSEPEQPEVQPAPEVPQVETTPLVKPKGGFFNRFRPTFTPAKPAPRTTPAPVEALPTPSEPVEPAPTETPEPEKTPTAIESPESSQSEQTAVEPAPETPAAEAVPTSTPKGGFFDRFRSTLTPAKPAPGKVVPSPVESPTATKPAAELSPKLPDLQPTTIPQSLEAPTLPEEPVESVQPAAPSEVEPASVAPESIGREATPAPEVTPAPPTQSQPEDRAQANKEKLNQLFDRLRTKSASPTVSPVPPSPSPAAIDAASAEPAESTQPESAESASPESSEPAEQPAS